MLQLAIQMSDVQIHVLTHDFFFCRNIQWIMQTEKDNTIRMMHSKD